MVTNKDFDMNNDGEITSNEIDLNTKMLEIELREEKAAAQKRMSWIALISIVFFTAMLFVPVIPESRVNALSDVLGLFYIAMASIVGFYFGATAYMSRK